MSLKLSTKIIKSLSERDLIQVRSWGDKSIYSALNSLTKGFHKGNGIFNV